MKVALIHDWLITFGGAERVLEQLLHLYPKADVFTIVDFLPKEDRGFLKGKNVRTSFIQKLPFARKKYRSYLPFMPFAIEQFDLSGYDLVVSSHYAVAKGVITGPDQKHICICHSPMRYAWDMQQQYLKQAGMAKNFKGLLARYLLYKLRFWDVRTEKGVDAFIAVSAFIQKRIGKVYRRKSTVIHSPVDVDKFAFCACKEDFYLTASRMVPYKRIDLIVESFAKRPDRKLVVIGAGPEEANIKRKLAPNIEFLGYQSFDVLHDHMQRAKAFVFAAEEDFGIIPLEAQACGTPVIAYGKGGALETIVGQDKACPTGRFFYEQSCESLNLALDDFESSNPIDPSACRENAMRFSNACYREKVCDFINAQFGGKDSRTDSQVQEDSVVKT